MKIRLIYFLFLMIISGSFLGCFKPPEFPVEPEIAFNNISFRPGDDSGTGDSLILSIDFQDGDGNLGLMGSEIQFPYHPSDLILDSNEDTVTISKKDLVLPLLLESPNGERRVFSEVDNRTPFNCQEYELLIRNEQVVDTFFIAKNPNNLNIYVEFYRKNRDGTYDFLDWTSVASPNRCGENFNGRFPVFDERNFEDGKPLAGTIDYSMVSVGFNLVMRQDTYKIDVRILDRDLNVSNVISTPDFTLQSITGN